MLAHFIDQKHISLYEVSKSTGIPYSTLSDVVSGKTDILNMKTGSVLCLARFFGVTVEELCAESAGNIAYIYNKGRSIFLEIADEVIEYMGPKNLIAFKHINSVDNNVLSVDTYFEDEDGRIFTEEDYIPVEDIIEPYNINIPKDISYEIKYESNSTLKVIDNSIMVSDNMAMTYHEGSAGDIEIEVTDIARMNNRMLLRLRDYAVLSTNMSANMQKRAINAVKRNTELIDVELRERGAYA